jgi:hypothetical protein
MSLALADRVRDTTTTTGTGTVTLSGTAPTGYQDFSVIGNGNTTYYTINAGSQWEVGVGTYSSTGPTLSRDAVLESSNANALVDFAAGVKDVFVTYPSDKAISDGYGLLPVANGGTGVTTSTGTGSVVLNTSPTLVTPTLGAASATSIANGLGAVGTPSYTFTGDTNTGMWSPSSDAIAFSTAGSERVRVDSSGNLLVGTTSVNLSRANIVGANGSGFEGITAFNNNSGSGIAGIQFGSDSTYTKAAVGLLRQDANGAGSLVFYNSSSTAAANWSTADERMRITAQGNVGIGISSPSYRLDVGGTVVGNTAGNSISISRLNGGAGANNVALQTTLQRLSNGTDWTTTALRVQAQVDASPFGYIDFLNGSTAAMTFGRASSEFMRIDSSGNVGIGTSSPGAALDIGGGGFFQISSSGTSRAKFFADASLTYLTSEGARPLTLSTNSAERMRIDSSGNVGIGTSSVAGGRTQINGQVSDTDGTGFDQGQLLITDSDNSTTSGLMLGYRWQGGVAEYARIQARNAVGATDLALQAGGGNVGIGNSSPGYRLDITAGDTTAGLGYAARFRSNATAAAAALQFTNNAVTAQNGLIACTDTGILTVQGDGASSVIAFRTNGSEAARITSGGELLVGATAAEGPGRIVSISTASGTACYAARNSAGASSNYAFFINAAGSAIIGSITNNADTGVLYNVTSDARAKHDIVDAPEASSLIDAMQVRSFKWNADDSEQRYGFIAQELVEVAPEAVSVPADEDAMMGVDYSKLVPILVKEMQSMRARLAELEASASTITFQGN